MRIGLYAYWGAVGDHNRNVPGHPLYQLFGLEMLAAAFQLEQIHFVSLYADKVEKTLEDVEFFIKKNQRLNILQKLDIKIISLAEALKNIEAYETVFLKARFRNPSRLNEKSYDALKFEKLIAATNTSKTFIIDSDGELPLDFFAKNPCHLLTYFANHDFYHKYTPQPLSIHTILPSLAKNFSSATRNTPPKYDVFFIGNEGLKDVTLSSWLQQLALQQFVVGVQGKWKSSHAFEILPRTSREAGYLALEQTLSTLQFSKPVYQQFDFLSPRIYEAHICGIPVFTQPGSSASTTFLEVEAYIDFSEKVKCLREGYSRDYANILLEQQRKLQQLENRILQVFK